MINTSVPMKKKIRAIEQTMQQRHENNYDIFNSSHRGTMTPSYASLHTEPIHAPLVVYNRVPKCASSTAIWIIRKLENSSRFKLKLQNWPKIEQILTPEQQVRSSIFLYTMLPYAIPNYAISELYQEPIATFAPMIVVFFKYFIFQIQLVRNISTEILQSDMIYVRHLHFLNFAK